LVITTQLDGTKAGRTTLPARKFMNICRALPEGATLDVSVEKERAVLRSGKSRFVLSTLPAAEFPNIDIIQPIVEFSIMQFSPINTGGIILLFGISYLLFEL